MERRKYILKFWNIWFQKNIEIMYMTEVSMLIQLIFDESGVKETIWNNRGISSTEIIMCENIHKKVQIIVCSNSQIKT